MFLTGGIKSNLEDKLEKFWALAFVASYNYELEQQAISFVQLATSLSNPRAQVTSI
jgi:hypothetical protein